MNKSKDFHWRDIEVSDKAIEAARDIGVPDPENHITTRKIELGLRERTEEVEELEEKLAEEARRTHDRWR